MIAHHVLKVLHEVEGTSIPQQFQLPVASPTSQGIIQALSTLQHGFAISRFNLRAMYCALQSSPYIPQASHFFDKSFVHRATPRSRCPVGGFEMGVRTEDGSFSVAGG